MSRSRSTSWRWFIFTTMLWTLALLLLTNTGWSMWFALAGGHGRYRLGAPRTMRQIGISYEGEGLYYVVTRLDHGVCSSIRAVPQRVTEREAPAGVEHYFDSQGAVTIDGVAPRWLWLRARREFCRKVQHVLDGGDATTVCMIGWPAAILWFAESQNASRWRAGDYTVRVVPGTGLQVIEGKNTPGISAALPYDGSELHGRVLPVRPIWSGQAFYAAFWFGVVCLARLGRRGMRAWRGLCEYCAYDLRGNVSGVCPECGASVNGEGG